MSIRFHEPMIFNADKLFSSVGICGTNAPAEVKKLQHMVMAAGYQQATGRILSINGQCDQATIEAIRWYQRLLNMSPSGLVHPVDTWFMLALRNAISPLWRPRNTAGTLHVREGQVTFDAEGLDYITAVVPFRQPQHTRQFSRILHWPKGDSGVTIGRGYDMKERSTGQILSDLRQAGIEEYKAVICSKASGLHGRSAGEFVIVCGPLVGEITHVQQVQLFEIAYRAKKEYTRVFYQHTFRKMPNAPTWDQLDPAIRDVVVDIFYQGAHDANGLIKAAIKGRSELIDYIKNDSIYMSFEPNRGRIRYLR